LENKKKKSNEFPNVNNEDKKSCKGVSFNVGSAPQMPPQSSLEKTKKKNNEFPNVNSEDKRFCKGVSFAPQMLPRSSLKKTKETSSLVDWKGNDNDININNNSNFKNEYSILTEENYKGNNNINNNNNNFKNDYNILTEGKGDESFSSVFEKVKIAEERMDHDNEDEMKDHDNEDEMVTINRTSNLKWIVDKKEEEAGSNDFGCSEYEKGGLGKENIDGGDINELRLDRKKKEKFLRDMENSLKKSLEEKKNYEKEQKKIIKVGKKNKLGVVKKKHDNSLSDTIEIIDKK
jgi:hypothetical protein